MEGKRLGAYRLVSELGSGGMATVYLGEVEESVAGLEPGDRVAVKVIHPHLFSAPGFFKRFYREVQVGKTVHHENVVRTIEVESAEADGVPQHFLVMEYVEGQTLRSLLTELGWVSENLCRHVGREVAEALAAIHGAGIIHRDLKPENVLITKDDVVKVMDLGVARIQREASRLSETGEFVGSVLYAAPEQFRRGGEDVDQRADLYALGLLLYELCTGRHPFGGMDLSEVMRQHLAEEPRPPSELNPRVSPFLESVIVTLLEKDREKRFPSTATLLEALRDGEDSLWWKSFGLPRAGDRRPMRRMRIPRETALYGREGELSTLRLLWEKVCDGEGQVLLLEGEAGIGKTRLLDEFVGMLDRVGQDASFLFGGYPPGGAATVAGAFSTAYREHFGTAGLKASLARHLTDTQALVPAFAALLTGEPPPEGCVRLNKDSIQTLFVEVTQRLAAERPTLVLIEDLHFSPEEGRALFSAIAHAVYGHRIFLVGTLRPGITPAWRASLAKLANVSHHNLTRLGPRGLQLLLKDALRSERLADALGAIIAVKSDGNPFFVFEILRGLRDTGLLAQSPDGSWVATESIREIRTPYSVKDLVVARISGLEEADRDLLDVAACSGYEFDPVVVSEALGMPRILALKRLSQLERAHQLIHSSGRQHRFDHHQVREALYESLPQLLREEYHGALGEALERRVLKKGKHEELSGPVVVDLCEHLLRGDRGEQGLQYLVGALSHLEAGYLNGPAVSLAELALEKPGLLVGCPRADILLRCADRLDLLGRREEQRKVLTEALEIAEEAEVHGTVIRARRRLGHLLSQLAEHDEAMAHLDAAMALARADGDSLEECRLGGGIGTVHLARSRYEEARLEFEKQLELAREMGDRRMEATAMGNLARLSMMTDRSEEAEDRLETVRGIFRRVGDRRKESVAVVNLGALHQSLGRYEKAREWFQRYLSLTREIGYRNGVAIATVNLGGVLRALGRLEEAHEHFRDAQAIFRETGDRHGVASCAGRVANLHLVFGDFEAARRLWDEGLRVFKEIGDPFWEASGLLWTGSAFEHEGDEEEARRLYGQALDIFREIGARTALPEAHLLMGRLHCARGREDEARSELETAVTLAREFLHYDSVVRGTAYSSLLPGGDVEEALRAFREHGFRQEVNERMETRFVLHRATGDLLHLAEAYRMLHQLRDHAPKSTRESMVTAVPLYRAIRDAWGRKNGAS
ncbi:MAG: serine/threonine-protein kinase [Planctomycetota bacterium]|jgi:tetratricopeptide (TPR) repeat protein